MSVERPDLVIRRASQVVTCAGFSQRPQRGSELGTLGIIRNGFVAIRGDRILAVGREQDFPPEWEDVETLDARGRAVLPGFVDPHTHLVYAGDRCGEFRMRLEGKSYEEIARAGGGILSTVRATRTATFEELVQATARRLDRMLLWGTTTVEIKSGYNLTPEGELRLLEAIAYLRHRHPVQLVPTFMGAHAVPPEYRDDPEGYVELLVRRMLPEVGRRGLAEFNDVFCEPGYFDRQQSRRILEEGRRWGLRPKVHADELAPGTGGAELAAEVGCVSADHLLQASEEGLRRMAEAGVVAVLLPGTSFFLMKERHAPARRMVELGLAVALGTDSNPGSCPMESMPLIIGLACLLLRLSPAEALAAATINAAHAIGRGHQVGSLEPGKRADVVILSEESYEAIPYRFGVNLVDTVIAGGRIVVRGGVRVA